MKTNLSGLPVVSGLLERAGLKFVDIGGRGSGLKNLLSLARYAHYYVSEPDAAEAGRLGDTLPAEQPWQATTIFGDAIASRRGEAQLYVTREPGMSSLLEPDSAVTGRYFQANKFEVDRIETVRTIPLDEAAEAHGFTDACFLKLDTQGTELDIMRSGARLLSGPVLGVYTETNFQPLYKGQSLFADLDGHLRAQGFTLFSMNRTSLRRMGYRPDVFSRRVTTWAHCLYLREPSMLRGRGDDAARRDLPRLLGLALTFQFYDLVFEIFELCGAVGVVPAGELKGLRKELEYLARHVTDRVCRDVAREEEEPKDFKKMLLSPSARDKNRAL
jgi:FkbM family methyltransferase